MTSVTLLWLNEQTAIAIMQQAVERFPKRVEVVMTADVHYLWKGCSKSTCWPNSVPNLWPYSVLIMSNNHWIIGNYRKHLNNFSIHIIFLFLRHLTIPKSDQFNCCQQQGLVCTNAFNYWSNSQNEEEIQRVWRTRLDAIQTVIIFKQIHKYLYIYSFYSLQNILYFCII